MLFVVVLVGCFNVGKLIFFNVFMCSCDVLVVDMFGVICDCYYGVCCIGEWLFVVVDIGGLFGIEDVFDVLIVCQVCLVIEEVQVIVFVVDVCDGLLLQDYVIFGELCCSGKLIIVVVNKIDGLDLDIVMVEFLVFGIYVMLLLLVVYNCGIEDLIVSVLLLLLLEEFDVEDEGEVGSICVVIVGCLNVGKLILINCLFGED